MIKQLISLDMISGLTNYLNINILCSLILLSGGTEDNSEKKKSLIDSPMI
jgi:hypothetical protein